MEAGYKVAAFDIFCDVETRRFCFKSVQVKYGELGFDSADLCAQLETLPPFPVLYGSGFEQQPELLEKISKRHPLIGNSPEVVASLKNPEKFFGLLEALHIPYPPTRLDKTENQYGWLVKRGGGAGGTHIRRGGLASEGEYYQQEIGGVSFSLLFLADGKSARVVGVNQQWQASESGSPFCYGGAVSHATIPEKTKSRVESALRGIVQATGLRGLNSMDFLVAGDEFFVLEINPRLSATFALYDGPWLLRQHLLACEGRLEQEKIADQLAKAQKIIFSPHDWVVPDNLVWPSWAADIPMPGSDIKAGQPVCSVLASAADAESAQQTVFARGRQLEAQLQPLFLNGIRHESHTT